MLDDNCANPLPLSTPQRVRGRLGAAEADLPDTFLKDVLAEQQAFVETMLGRALAPEDPSFALAASATTDLAAAMALVRLTGAASAGADYRIGKLDVRRRAQLETWLRLIPELRASAERALDALRREGRARGFVLINGEE